MTPNTRAKIVPALLLALPLPIAGFTPHLMGVDPTAAFFYVVAAFTVVMALALAGAADLDPHRRDFHGGAPAYWIPATVWLLAVVAAVLTPLACAVPGMQWVFLLAGGIHALADFGSRVKNR